MSIRSRIKSAVSKVKSVASNIKSNIKTGLGVVKDATRSFTANLPSFSQLKDPYSSIASVGNAFSAAKNVITGNNNKSFQIPLTPAQTRRFVSAFSPASASNPKPTSGSVALGPTNRPASSSTSLTQTANTADAAHNPSLGLSGAELASYSRPSSITTSAGSLASQSTGAGGGTGQMSLSSTPAIYDPTSDVTQTNAALGVDSAPPVEQKTPELTPDEKARQDYLNLGQENLDTTDAELARAEKKALRESGIEAARQQLNNTTNQINAIEAKQNTDLANMRITAGKEGVVEAVYGQQSAQIKLEAAAQIYPLQAQLELDQGDLIAARERLDRLSSLYTKQVDRRASYREDMQKLNWEVFTASEKRQLEANNKKSAFKESLLKDEIGTWRDALEQALKDGNKTLVNYLSNNKPPINVDAPNFDREVNAWRNDWMSGVARYGKTKVTAPSAVNVDAQNWLYRQPSFTQEDIEAFNTDPSFRAWVLRQRELEKSSSSGSSDENPY